MSGSIMANAVRLVAVAIMASAAYNIRLYAIQVRYFDIFCCTRIDIRTAQRMMWLKPLS